MKITLIYPPYEAEEVFSFLSDSAPLLPPLGLAYIAAYLREHSYDVSIIDSPALGLGVDEAAQKVAAEKPQLIGITANSPLYSRALGLGKRIKELLPDSKIVLGGYHPTFLSQEVLRNNFVDFIVKGEGEETFLELCRAMEDGGSFSSIKGLGLKDDGRLVFNEDREFILDLDRLPFPAYDLLPMESYHTGNNIGRDSRVISIMASRGCLSNCYFCTSPLFWKRAQRKHSPEYVISLMNHLYQNFRKSSFQFRDDTFTFDKDWVMRLCNLMIANKHKYRWDCYCRFDTIDEELLKLMRRAGCYQMSLGVESSNEAILKNIKGFGKRDVYKGMRLLKKYGFKTRLFFMVGPPAKTDADIDGIAEFAIELDPDVLNITATIPYPGSSFYSSMAKRGKEPRFDASIPRVYEGFCDFDGFSRDYIAKKIKQIYRRFYLRPRYIMKQLFSIRSPMDCYNLLFGGVSIIKVLIGKNILYLKNMRFAMPDIKRYKKYFKFVRRKPFLIFAVAKSFALALFFKKVVIRKLELAITYDCQCRCSKCSSYKLNNANHKELTLEEIKRIADQAKALGTFQVNLIGGEPLLRGDILEIIKCFNVNRTFLSISTNGALLNEHRIKELKKAGIDFIKISLDSPYPSEHDQKRAYAGLFNIIMKALDFIKAEGLLCELTTVATKENIRSGNIWKLAQMCKEKDVILGLTIPAVCGRWSEQYDVILEDADRDTLKDLLKQPHVIRDTQTGMFRSQCSAGREQVYITAYGDVLPCSVVQISFGNIRQEGLKAIWARMQKSNMFTKSKDICLAGEDEDFINKYLKPINQMDEMPVPVEYFSKL